MKKIIILLAVLLLLPAPAVYAAGEPGVSAQSAILISGDDGTVIYEKNSHEKLAMASTTKIMTALLTLEEAERSGDPVIDITAEMVAVEGSSMGLKDGDRLTLINLTSGMLLASGNDAANAAAIYLGGSQEGFAELMNARAGEIGMTETNFVTPSGLDDDEHYSTAYDMALLGREAMGNEEFARIAGSSTLQVEFVEPEQRISYQNHNKLLRIYDGCIGIKTGFTKKAGRTLVSAAQRDGTTLIAVTLNAPDDWDDHMAMFDYGFSKVKTVNMGGEVLPESIPVAGSGKQGVTVCTSQQVSMTLPIEEAQGVESRVLLPKFLYAPVKAGEKIGRVQYLSGGTEIYSVPIIATEGAEQVVLPERTWWEKLTDFFNNTFS